MINVYASKIPMQWVSTKTGDKIKFLEFKNAKDPKGTIYFGLRQTRPEGYELSSNFDAAMIEAIKAKGGIKTNMILVKGVETKYTGGKLWMVLKPGCEIIVLDAIAKTTKFRKVVEGQDGNKAAEVEQSLKEVVRKEIQKALKEYGVETMYFANPGGTEQIQIGKTTPAAHRFYNVDKWKDAALSLGSVITDRGDDWLAMRPDNTKLGTFDKMTNIGTLEM
jgi:hypothetical protein